MNFKTSNIHTWEGSLYKKGCLNTDVFPCPYFPVFGLNTDLRSKSPYSVLIQEITDQKKLCIWTLFTQ